MKQGELRQAPMAWNTEPELPQLRLNMTLQQWTKWKLRWAAYKCHTGLTSKDDCLDYLWSSFSEELALVVIDNLELNVDFGLNFGSFRIPFRPGTHKYVGFLWPIRKGFPEEAGVKMYFSTEPIG